MAKLVFGPIVSDARNKQGGTVFTKTRFGSMARRKVSPVQPRTSYQMNVRAGFTALSKLWSDATMDANRAAWITLADSYPVKDIFGQTQRLTGHQLFLELNRNLQAVGVATPLLVAPTTLACGYPGPLAAAHDGPPVTSFIIDPATLATASESYIVSATPGISPGRGGAGARFRQILAAAGPGAHDLDILTAYTAKFGTPITARQIFIRLKYVTTATGAASLPSEVSITI
jgi:hypothetical protein